MNCCFFTYFIIYPTILFANELQIRELETDEAVTDCIIKVIEQIKWEKPTLDVSIINGNDMLVIPVLRKVQGVRFVYRKFVWDTNTIMADVYVIMTNDYEELKRGLNVATAEFFWNTKVKFIVVIRDINEQLSNIAHLLLDHSIYNVSVLGKVNDVYAIYNFNSKSDSCNRPESLELFSECSRVNDENIFKARQFRGFRGCTINVVSLNNWPFVNYDYSSDIVYSMGFEQYILKLFEDHHGITINFMQYVKINKFEKVVKHFPYTKTFEKLGTNVIEAAIGGFSLLNGKHLNYSFTYPLIIDDMALIVRRTDIMSMWQAILKLNLMTVIMFSIMFVIFSFIVVVIALFPRKERDVILDILIVLGYFLEKTSVNVIKSGISSRMFFICLLLLVFIIPYVLQAYLVSVTTHPVRIEQKKDPEEIYKTFKGIIYTGWGAKDLTHDLRDCGTEFECLTTVARTKDDLLFTMVSTTTYESYTWMLTDDRCNLQLYKISDPFVMLPRTIYFRRGSIFVKAFDKFFIKMMSGGLLSKYKSNFILEQGIKCRAVYQPAHVPLTLYNCKDIFIVLIIGYCLSVAVFVFECIFMKYFLTLPFK